MLTFKQSIGYRAAAFSIMPLPAPEIERVLATLSEFFGGVSQSGFVPQTPEKEMQLAQALAQAAPTLTAIGRGLQAQLDSEYSMILIDRAWLDELTLDTRAALLFTLSMAMGSPTATDKVDRKVVWDVRALGDDMAHGHIPTFSEHAHEAALHTDTQYYQAPERYMLLYANQPAHCGGGVSIYRDIASVEQVLAQTEQGRWALELLRHEILPFRVPTSFTTDGKPETVEITYARILGDDLHIRYRKDTLARGFVVDPAKSTPQIRQALDIFETELHRPEATHSLTLQRDGLMLFNNHECLHGRTEFSDLSRHAFRIRIAQR